MLPLTMVTAMVKVTSRKILERMIFFLGSILTLQRIMIGKHMTELVSFDSFNVPRIDRLTQHVRDNIQDTR